MGILNRRNAVVGWAVWKLAKRIVRRKARAAVPGAATNGGVRMKHVLLAGAAALGGALFFWRRRSGDGDATSGDGDATE